MTFLVDVLGGIVELLCGWRCGEWEIQVGTVVRGPHRDGLGAASRCTGARLVAECSWWGRKHVCRVNLGRNRVMGVLAEG